MYSVSDSHKTGLPHSDICAYNAFYQLNTAFRRLTRPSSPLIAKASTVCALSLNHTTPNGFALNAHLVNLVSSVVGHILMYAPASFVKSSTTWTLLPYHCLLFSIRKCSTTVNSTTVSHAFWLRDLWIVCMTAFMNNRANVRYRRYRLFAQGGLTLLTGACSSSLGFVR